MLFHIHIHAAHDSLPFRAHIISEHRNMRVLYHRVCCGQNGIFNAVFVAVAVHIKKNRFVVKGFKRRNKLRARHTGRIQINKNMIGETAFLAKKRIYIGFSRIAAVVKRNDFFAIREQFGCHIQRLAKIGIFVKTRHHWIFGGAFSKRKVVYAEKHHGQCWKKLGLVFQRKLQRRIIAHNDGFIVVVRSQTGFQKITVRNAILLVAPFARIHKNNVVLKSLRIKNLFKSLPLSFVGVIKRVVRTQKKHAVFHFVRINDFIIFDFLPCNKKIENHHARNQKAEYS